MAIQSEGFGPTGRLTALTRNEQVRLSKRSWWEVMFEGGDTLAEWETMGTRYAALLPWLQPRSRWEDLDHGRLVAARLWCPNGQVGEVQATGPYRIFQFKVARRSMAGEDREAHVIGVVVDDDGNCEGYLWSEDRRQLGQFRSNVRVMHELFKVGPFNLEVIGLRL